MLLLATLLVAPTIDALLLRTAARPSFVAKTSRAVVAAGTPAGREDEGRLPARAPYLLSGLPRPRYRGSLMGFLHRTRLWYLVAIGYLAAALRLSSASPVPLTGVGFAIRVAAAAFTSANVFISDAYHNADRLEHASYTTEHELTWMRWDYVGISAILAHNLWLWSSNVGWAGYSRLASIYSAICLGLVSFLAPKLRGDRDSYGAGSTKVVKYLTGTQFLPALTYLVLTYPAAGFFPAEGVIYCVFGFGLVLYLTKKPQVQTCLSYLPCTHGCGACPAEGTPRELSHALEQPVTVSNSQYREKHCIQPLPCPPVAVGRPWVPRVVPSLCGARPPDVNGIRSPRYRAASGARRRAGVTLRGALQPRDAALGSLAVDAAILPIAK